MAIGMKTTISSMYKAVYIRDKALSLKEDVMRLLDTVGKDNRVEIAKISNDNNYIIFSYERK